MSEANCTCVCRNCHIRSRRSPREIETGQRSPLGVTRWASHAVQRLIDSSRLDLGYLCNLLVIYLFF